VTSRFHNIVIYHHNVIGNLFGVTILFISQCSMFKKRAGKFLRRGNGLDGAPDSVAHFRGAFPALPNSDRARPWRRQMQSLKG
jgi:hypothetical protein